MILAAAAMGAPAAHAAGNEAWPRQGPLADAIYDVLPRSDAGFYLDFDKEFRPFFARDAKARDTDVIDCEAGRQFEVHGGTKGGGIAVAVCSRNAERILELARTTGAHHIREWSAPPSSAATAKQMGLVERHKTQGNGDEYHFFPQVLVGHGVFIIHTVVVYEKKSRRAAVVQSSPYPTCEYGRNQAFPLCKDIEGTLRSIAKRALHRQPPF